MENEKEVSCYTEELHCAVLTVKVGSVSKNAVSFQRSTWKGCLKKPSTHIPKRLPTTSSSTQLFFGSCSQTKGAGQRAPAADFAGPQVPSPSRNLKRERG